MNFESFLELTLRAVNAKLPSGRKAHYRKVNKTNNVVYTGMYLETGGKDYASPVLYMESAFEQVRSEADIEAVSDEMVRILIAPVPEEENVWKIPEFDFARQRIVFRLMRLRDNEDFLKQIPHREFLDLAVTYGVLIPCEKPQSGLAQVTEEMRKTWGLSEEALYALALQNTQDLLGEVMKPLTEFVKNDLSQMSPEEEPRMKEAEQCLMLTNRLDFFGASVILYSKKLKEYAEEKQSDLYILPSSVHEVLVVQAKRRQKERWMRFLKALSEEVYRREDVLTNRLYVFHRESGIITADSDTVF